MLEGSAAVLELQEERAHRERRDCGDLGREFIAFN